MPKAFFRMECGADVSAITDETQLAKLTSRLEKMRDGTERPVFFWPSGCVVEGAVAEHILACGIGLPVDDKGGCNGIRGNGEKVTESTRAEDRN